MSESDLQSTLAAIWRIESPRLIARLSRVTRDVGRAEDIAQDAFVCALAHPDRTIVITTGEVKALVANFTDQWHRPPSREEFNQLIDDRVREEVLYREALRLGLDRDDEIVRRRMQQKMTFLAEDSESVREPSETELAQWYAANGARFAEPATVTLRQRLFGFDERGPHAFADAQRALVAGPREGGDRGFFDERYVNSTHDDLVKLFGQRFADAAFAAPAGRWSGPYRSAYGWHDLFVERMVPARVPALAEVRDDVRSAWIAQARDRATRSAYEAVRSRYRVVVNGGAQ